LQFGVSLSWIGAFARMDAILRIVGNDDGPPARPLDAIIDDVEIRDKPQQRGFVHTVLARAGKEKKRLFGLVSLGLETKFGDFTKNKINAMNDKYAVRMTDIINLTQKPTCQRRTAIAMRGQYKRWTPSAILRACFGNGWSQQRLSSRNVQATSLKGAADFYRAGANHIGKMRQAVAFKYMGLMTKHLDEVVVNVALCILEISFDESEQSTRIGDEVGRFTMMMMHCKMKLFFEDGREHAIQVPLPPAFLSNTKTETLLNVLRARLPLSVQKLVDRAVLTVIWIGSDSARSCLKVGRHATSMANVLLIRPHGAEPFLRGLLVGHGRCLMHQVGIVMGKVFKKLNLLNPMFCGCCLMQKGGSKALVRNAVKARFRCIEISFSGSAPPPGNKEYLLSLFAQLNQADNDTNILIRDSQYDPTPIGVYKKRIEARERLSRNLAHSEFRDGKITKLRHDCPVGCHSSPEEAKAEIEADIDTSHLSNTLGVPALNRWVKLFKPLAWWLVGTKLGYMTAGIDDLMEDMESVGQLLDVEAYAIGDADTHAKKQQARFRRLRAWLKDKNTADFQSIGSVVISPLVAVMGVFFSNMRVGKQTMGRLDFCIPSRNPGVKVIMQYFVYLRSLDHPFWLAVVGVGDWTSRLQGLVAGSVFEIIAELFMRRRLFSEIPVSETLIFGDFGDITR
jgi:hypothetical protein